MQTQTIELISKLKSAKSKVEILNIVSVTHLELKNRLQDINIRFHPEESCDSQGVVAGERFSNDNRYLYDVYKEINYIRIGLNGNWSSILDDEKRFDEIKNVIEETLLNLNNQ